MGPQPPPAPGTPNRLAFHWRLLLALLSLSLLLSACTNSGDFGKFITQEVAKQGGPSTNGILPEVQATWTIKRDNSGFQAVVTGTSFEELDGVMRHAFGKPAASLDADVNGRPQRMWGTPDTPVVIQLVGRADGAEVICIKGMRGMPGSVPAAPPGKR